MERCYWNLLQFEVEDSIQGVWILDVRDELPGKRPVLVTELTYAPSVLVKRSQELRS